jgi:hypothetical protein
MHHERLKLLQFAWVLLRWWNELKALSKRDQEYPNTPLGVRIRGVQMSCGRNRRGDHANGCGFQVHHIDLPQILF